MKAIDFNGQSKNLYHLIETVHGLTNSKKNLTQTIEKLKGSTKKKDINEREHSEKRLASIEAAIKNLNDNGATVRATGLCKTVEVGDVLMCDGFPSHPQAQLRGGVSISKIGFVS